jgi:hypothetical protein
MPVPFAVSDTPQRRAYGAKPSIWDIMGYHGYFWASNDFQIKSKLILVGFKAGKKKLLTKSLEK